MTLSKFSAKLTYATTVEYVVVEGELNIYVVGSTGWQGSEWCSVLNCFEGSLVGNSYAG